MLNMETPHRVRQGGTDIHLTLPMATTYEDLAEMEGQTDPFSGTVMTEALNMSIYRKGSLLFFGQKAKESVKDSDRVAEIARFVADDPDGHQALVDATIIKGDLKGYTAAITGRVLAARVQK